MKKILIWKNSKIGLELRSCKLKSNFSIFPPYMLSKDVRLKRPI
jgi:hypothetical protein